jgi:O-antigen ligase
MITTRFDQRLPFYLIILLSVSFSLSIFTMQLFGGTLALLWLFEKNSEKKKAADRIVMMVTLYGLVRLLAIIFSEYTSVSVHSLYKEALFYLSVFSIGFYMKVFDSRKIRLIIYFFLVGAALNSVIGLINFNFGLVERAQSLSSGYMTFSVYLLTSFAMAIILSGFEEIKEKYFYIHILLTGLILTGIVSSLGRVNIVIAVLILITGIFLKKIRVKQVLLLGIVAFILSSVSFLNNSTEINQRIEAPAQLSDRDIIYKGAGEIMWEHPVLGFGPRTFNEIFPLREELTDKGVGSWHNDLLQVYFESGFIGLMTYILMIVIIFSSGIGFVMKNKGEGNNIIVLSTLVSIGAMLLSSVFSGFIDSPVLSIVFVFLISLQASEVYRSKLHSR